MKNREMCLIHNVFFHTTKSVDPNTSFAFVSIDADLYDPIYEGLKYFYPKLGQGGYIAVHDFNSKLYAGANKAVMDFCKENTIPYVPVLNGCGSVVIPK